VISGREGEDRPEKWKGSKESNSEKCGRGGVWELRRKREPGIQPALPIRTTARFRSEEKIFAVNHLDPKIWIEGQRKKREGKMKNKEESRRMLDTSVSQKNLGLMKDDDGQGRL